MADESTQKWLGRNRPPRVQITYDLETRGAIEKKELPLVVGIIADLSGTTATDSVTELKKRKFIEIDRDNFNDVMKSIKPTLNIAALDKAAQPIVFETLDDFTPDRLVEKVDALKELLTTRQNLSDLLVIVDGKDTLDAALLTEAKNVKALPPAPAILSPADADAAVGTAQGKADAAVAAVAAAKEAAAAAAAAATEKPDDADLKTKSADAATALADAQKKSDDAAAALTAALAAQTEAKKGATP
jgi:type VI secretion system protein ImpB